MVTVGQIGAAFDLGRTVGPLAFVQHAVAETWRLDADIGSYRVKQLWPGDDPDGPIN